jgi:integrase
LPRWATPHDLRHFYASLLIRSGAGVKVVQARLRRSSAKVTLDVYAHQWPDDEDCTRAAVDDTFAHNGAASRAITAP